MRTSNRPSGLPAKALATAGVRPLPKVTLTMSPRLVRILKPALIVFAVLLVGAQFIRPAKNLSTAAHGPDDLTVLRPPAPEVKAVLERACFDCHSNNTRYPWYAEIQPIGWWLADHVKEGKAHLNFSNFGTYPAKRQERKLNELMDEVEEGQMPLTSYKLVHADARLTPDEIKALTDWAATVRENLPVK
jgi:hypothetical protein